MSENGLAEKIQCLKQKMDPFMENYGEMGRGYCSDGNLRRVLTARGMDVDKAAAQLLKTLEWRQKEDPATIVCPACQADPHSHNLRQVGLDAMDRPVIYACFSQGANRFDIEATEKHVIQVLETTLAAHASGGDGAEVEQWIWVIDFHGFSLRDCDPRSATMVIDLLQHYPERLHRVVFLDSPFIFGALWSAIRSVLDDRTAGKVPYARRSAPGMRGSGYRARDRSRDSRRPGHRLPAVHLGFDTVAGRRDDLAPQPGCQLRPTDA